MGKVSKTSQFTVVSCSCVHYFRVRDLVKVQRPNPRHECNQIQDGSDHDEPVHIVFLQLTEYAHLIMALYYKMQFIHNATSGIVFGALEILIICIEATSMAFLRKSAIAKSGGGKWLALGTIGYGAVAMVFREVLKFASMARANALWDAGSIVLVTLVGKFVYGERYTQRQWLGVGFAVAAVLCMIGPEVAPGKV